MSAVNFKVCHFSFFLEKEKKIPIMFHLFLYFALFPQKRINPIHVDGFYKSCSFSTFLVLCHLTF